ncbi:MAG: hypothetical protein AB7P03_00515 [Kofleriaceae bacterium]
MTRSASFSAPPGFRDSAKPALAASEVVASTYAIRDEIARTETGMVFEARDMMLDRPVVLKLAWRDPGAPSLIVEARRCAQVRDTCAVAIFGMGHHNGVEFVVGERVTGRLLSEVLAPTLAAELYLTKLRAVFSAVSRAHEHGVAVGDISGATVLITEDNRVVLGRLSLSQIPAFGRIGQVLAPEVVRGEVPASDPSAAEAIDLYGLGCVAIEMACGTAPFASDDRDTELRGHADQPPPRLIDLRPDLPHELSDLVEWLLSKNPAARPASAQDVVAQIDAIIERLGTKARSIRVLIVDDDGSRARWLWSLARRALAAAQVEIASEGGDAVHKLNRDHPDLVFVSANLRGIMNALELCMYARGLETEHPPQLVVIGDVSQRDRTLFANASVPFIANNGGLANALIERVRTTAAEPQRRRKPRKTVSG